MIESWGAVGRARSTFLAGTFAFAMLAFGLGPAVSEAEARSFGTSTSFGFYTGKPPAFIGQVDSKKRKCVAGRLVKVFRKRPGRDRLIGRDRGSSTGQWIVERRSLPRGRYYAKVPRKRFGPGRRHVCRAYTSSKIPVRP